MGRQSKLQLLLGICSRPGSTAAPRAPTLADRDAALARAQQAPVAKQNLDIALVLDRTGSMGDELLYLSSEFQALAATLTARHPDATQRWALVTYGDLEDGEPVQSIPFTTDAVAFHEELLYLHAWGGGDYPESPEAGLETALSLDWSTGTDARMVFWVADAPHHDANATAFADAVHAAATSDVHIYPVAASGTDALTEYSMRSAAQLTLGRYLFLTDDSGVGGAHVEPTIPCYFVTRLDQAIERMVDIEMTGVYREPLADEVIRTGGDPTNGSCTLADERVVVVF